MKRILSMLLALLMVIGIMPVTAMAEEVNEIELEQQVQEEVSEEMVLESVETEAEFGIRIYRKENRNA